ncbi:unnamed protein product, partial [Brenthis ino]
MVILCLQKEAVDSVTTGQLLPSSLKEMLKAVLLFLPFTMASIKININPATKFSKETVDITGFEESRTTKTELETFKITEHIPLKATILDHGRRNVLVTVKEFHNNSSAPSVAKGGIKEEVLETLSTTWSESEALSIARDITFKYGSLSYSYTSYWGKEVNKSKTKILTTTSDVEVSLKPGQSVKAILSATRGTLSLKVDYSATVHGDIYCRYTFFFIPIYGQEFEVNKYLDLMNLPHSVISSEIISVDYYYGAQVVIKDIESDKSLLIEPVLIL